ncbi:hypothetical protein Hypma_012114 [Hypsizygus marmoreus]|uniref:BTB domain-containing protein n=1 Tax=Hypsizygus marmoreus TaxID=39966 RepID=A0A369JJ12_HYPMA|nr:hypothetical protein Hypma_012114 [Hypsizygus marmoreus]
MENTTSQSPSDHESERSDSQLSESQQPITVWFEDGTLTLIAGTSSFRIYGGILAAKSSVFKDMYDSANPPPIEKGPPVLTLDDSAMELAYFLKALHDTEFFLPPTPTYAAPLAIVAGVLRLSDKYGVLHLRKRAIEHLSIVYPTSLIEWTSSPQFTHPNPSDHLIAIKLAREFDIPWIRPMAIYQYVSQPLDDVLESLPFSGFTKEDIQLCIRGIRALKTLQLLQAPIVRVSPKCIDQWSCKAAERRMWDSIVTDDRSDPLAPPLLWTGHGVCSRCATLTATHSTREQVWNEIPVSLRLQPWNELKKLKEEAAVL